MAFKNRLNEILQKYPFIHIDLSGELSIIVPLTGARKVTDNFSNDPDKPISLVFFGDNTCKADLERRKFFYGTVEDRSSTFDNLFSKLISDLQILHSEPELPLQDQIFLQEIIKNLNNLKVKAHTFGRDNPGLETMENDFKYGDEIFAARGEFIVKTTPDNVRALNIPNVVSLAGPEKNRNQKLISREMSNDCLNALSLVKEPVKVNKLLLISEALEKISDSKEYLGSKNDKTPKELFKKIYQFIQEKDKSLEGQSPEVFQTMEENWAYVGDADGDYSGWSAEEITEAVKLLFNQAKILGDESKKDEPKTFEAIYSTSIAQYKEHYPNAGMDSRTKTYQLFVLQTFLHLCIMELRLKNKEGAQNFLKIFQDRGALNKLITQLCTDEKAFIKMMSDEFQLSPDEYQSILDATYTIATDHLEADHFDELRVACTRDVVHNAHYIVMGGRLCWSTAPITENGNLNSLSQQQEASQSHFEKFYDEREMYIKRFETVETINALLNKNFDEESRQYCLSNVQNLSTNQKNELLLKAIFSKKYPLAQVLIEQSEKEFFSDAFIAALRQNPINPAFINVFLNKDPKYAKYIEGEHLLQAVQNGELELVKIILKYKPELVEYTDNYKQTPLIHACKNGKVGVVEYLIGIGANIRARTIIPFPYEYEKNAVYLSGRTAKDWVEALPENDSENSAKLISLLDNYYENIENNFKLYPDYKDSLNIVHLNAAVNYGDLKLINLYVTYCPHLKSIFSEEDSARATKNNLQQELITQIIPYQNTYRKLLAELQLKERKLQIKYGDAEGEAVKCIYSLNNKLTKAGNDFFLNEITAESLQDFKDECIQAMDEAKPILANHRGWHGYPAFFRAVLGVLSALTVIPALAVLLGTEKGYVGTFFSKAQTDSTEKLSQFEADLDKMNTNISGMLTK